MAIRASIIKQFWDQIKIRLISKLINDISGVLQKLLRYFNDAINLSPFMLSLSVLPAIFLNLNKALLLLSAGKLKIATLVFEAGSYL